MKLTEEQKKVVEENHNLIYWYATQKSAKHIEYLNVYYDVLAIELCKSAIHYDPSRGSFSNYFKLRADSAVYKEYRKTLAKKRDGVEVELRDTTTNVGVGGIDELLDELYLKDWINDSDSEILKLRLQGMNQTQIAEIVGVSQAQVSRTLIKLKEKYYEFNR